MSFDRIKGGFKVVNGSRTVQQQFNGQPMAGLNEESAKSLQELRIIQTNLVFLNGLDIKQSKEEILKKKAFMGQYGNIKKVIVKTEGNRDSNSVGVYISFSHPQEASIAILALDQFELDSKILRAFYGSTKYCNSFLNGTVCGKKECPYLHEKAKDYTFNKDEKFYINYKEIALKVVTSKISFFNNYTATQNPVFPDVAEIIKQARAELASSQPNNALKMIEGNKSSSLMISNMPICTWDEDISEKSEINNQLNSQQQDTNGLKNTLKEVKPNSSPISETASSKAIETFNYLQSQQNKDSNLMEQIISKIEKQQLQLPQQPFPIDLAQYQQSQGIDSQNRFVPPSQSSFISTIPSILQAPWNRNQQKFLTGLSATRFVPINWGPVGSKAYRQNYSLAPKLMLENEEDEQEFEILNQKINETIKIHALNYPAQPYKFSELAKFLVENYSSLHFKISEYVFGEIWPSETVENIYFTIDDRNIIAYQVSEAFDQQKLALYFPTNLCGHFIDRKEQFEEIEQVFANFPNKIIRQESNHQRKRSSNSLQVDPEQAGIQLIDMKEQINQNQKTQSLSNKMIISSDKTKIEKKKVVSNQEQQQQKSKDEIKQQQNIQMIKTVEKTNSKDEKSIMDNFELKQEAEDKLESVFIQAKGTNTFKKSNKEESLINGKKQKKKEVINRFAILEDDENEEDSNNNRKQENNMKEQGNTSRADNHEESSKMDNKSQLAQVSSTQSLNLSKKQKQNKKKEKNSTNTVVTVLDGNESQLSNKVIKEKQEISSEQNNNQTSNKGDDSQSEDKGNNSEIVKETQSSKSQQQEKKKKKKNKQNNNQPSESKKPASVIINSNENEAKQPQENETDSAYEPEKDNDSRKNDRKSSVTEELEANGNEQSASINEKDDLNVISEKISAEKKQSEVLNSKQKKSNKKSVGNNKKVAMNSTVNEQQQRKEQLLFLKQEQEKNKQLLKNQNSQSTQQPGKKSKSQQQLQQQQQKQETEKSNSNQAQKQQDISQQAEIKVEKKQDLQKQAQKALLEQFFDKSQPKNALASLKQQVAKAIATAIDPTKIDDSEIEIKEDIKKIKNQDDQVVKDKSQDDQDKSNLNQGKEEKIKGKDEKIKGKDEKEYENQNKQEIIQQDKKIECKDISNIKVEGLVEEDQQNAKSDCEQFSEIQEKKSKEEEQKEQPRQLEQIQEQNVTAEQQSDDSLDNTSSSNQEDKGEDDNNQDGQNGQMKMSQHRSRSKNIIARLLPTNEMFLASQLPSHQYNSIEIYY